MRSEGHEARREEDALIRVLRSWRLAGPTLGLGERVAAHAMTWPQELRDRPSYRIRPRWSFGWLFPRLASLAAGVAIGVLVGLASPDADELASGVYSSLFDQQGTVLTALDTETSELTP